MNNRAADSVSTQQPGSAEQRECRKPTRRDLEIWPVGYGSTWPLCDVVVIHSGDDHVILVGLVCETAGGDAWVRPFGMFAPFELLDLELEFGGELPPGLGASAGQFRQRDDPVRGHRADQAGPGVDAQCVSVQPAEQLTAGVGVPHGWIPQQALQY